MRKRAAPARRSVLAAAVLAATLALVPLRVPSCAAATPAAPELRGDASIYAAEADRLYRFLAIAKTEPEARAIEDEIWRHWFLAPDAKAAELMAKAQDRREDYDFAGAVTVLDELVAYAPDWPEAWNQRATIKFMQGDLTGSLTDVEETLAREPRHFGSLAGMALILMQQGRVEQAHAVLLRAVKIDPFLRERALLPPGQDL